MSKANTATSKASKLVNEFVLQQDKGGFYKQVFTGNEGKTLLSRHVGDGLVAVDYGDTCMDARHRRVFKLRKGQQINVYVKRSGLVQTYGEGCHGRVPTKRSTASKVGSFGLALPTSGKRERKLTPTPPQRERPTLALSDLVKSLVAELQKQGVDIVS
jgi:hypothetical protein